MAERFDFDSVYSRYHDRISRYLERMVGSRTAEDVTQEVFLKINRALPDFKGQSSLSTWVYRIATNSALDAIRSRAQRQDSRTVPLENPEGEVEAACAGTVRKSLSAERKAVRDEMTECIREYVDRLPSDYRTVIILSEIKDLKNREIAEILAISLDAVKIRLHRARAQLKAEFEAGCRFYHDEDGNLACDRKKSEKDCQ